jgi:hypothetical protein
MCKSKVSPVTAIVLLNEELKSTRDKIIDKIHSVHKIYLDCNNGIETCKSENKKDLAKLLRSKYLYLRSQEKIFQDLMRKVDDAIEIEKSGRKKEALEDSKKSFAALNEIASRDDVAKILELDEEYLQEVTQELRKAFPDLTEVDAYIEKEFKERTSTEGQPIRKRYTKRISTL